LLGSKWRQKWEKGKEIVALKGSLKPITLQAPGTKSEADMPEADAAAVVVLVERSALVYDGSSAIYTGQSEGGGGQLAANVGEGHTQ
jgi:hypothetical protein